jgi:hypothetical protein
VIVLRHREFAAEKEISESVLVEHAMNRDALLAFLEVDAVILRAIAV